jgi:succinoglycan biosynthesis transport protein ExoP
MRNSGSMLDDAADDLAPHRMHKPNGTGIRDARGFWLILRWRAARIVALVLATVALAGAALAILPPKYKATTIVLVDPRQPRVTQNEAVIAGIGADAAAVESQVELIESAALAEKVIKRHHLDADPDFASPSILETIVDNVLAMIGRTPDNPDERRMSRLVYKFQQGLTVRRRGLTYILEINYVSKDPAKAARLSGAVADAYLDDQRSAKSAITTRASSWLGDRIEEMRERVRTSERAVADYKSANNIVDVTQGNKLVARQVEDVTQQLALARARAADARARLERAQQVSSRTFDPAALSESLQSQVIANLRSQYAEAARSEAEFNALYGSRYPGLVAVRAQLADLRRQIEAEIARIQVGVRNEYQVATALEASLEAELTRLKTQSASLNEANVKLHELEREAQANRTLFEQFLNRAKETTEQETLQFADARIVSPAMIPLKPDRPPAALLLAIAAFGGLVLAIGLILIMEQMRRGMRTDDDVRQALSLPCLGILPHRGKRTARDHRGVSPRGMSARPALFGARKAQLDASTSYDVNLRTIRARLRQDQVPGRCEVLAVISALPGEGKSTFACNFALAAAAAGINTLLIDGDAYTSSLTRMFGIKGPGLCEVLAGESALWPAMRKHQRTGLHILGARAEASAPPQHGSLNATALESLLETCRKTFDLVVVDSPAILPVAETTAPICFADRAVLIVEWQRTAREAVADAIDLIGPQHSHKIGGVVLNKVAMGWYRLVHDDRYVGDYGYYATVQAARLPGALEAGGPQ